MSGEERKEMERRDEVNNYLAKKFLVIAVTMFEEGPKQSIPHPTTSLQRFSDIWIEKELFSSSLSSR